MFTRPLALIAAFLSALVGATAALAAPVFFIDGRGWGHGIGMAQYGAYGYALEEGRSYAWILAHYYPGTALGPARTSGVRVLLADDRAAIGIGSDAPFRATDAAGRTYELPAGRVRLGRDLELEIGGEARALASPVRFSPGTRVLELDGRRYRGDLVVRADGGSLAAVNHVGLEEYLYGVVPDEMPPGWAMEALKAQAVAARSYALASRRSSGPFDLFADTRSQVYGGVASEEPRTNAAVAATAGQVLYHDGRVAHTFFHSTSGGRTAAIRDVWPTAQPLPYLVSVSDPYDRLSPYHRWGPFRYAGRALTARLGSLAPRGSLADLRVTRNGSGRVASVLATGSRGASRMPGTTFQARLGLRSSWFTVGVLSLGGTGRVTFGERATLRGVARGVRGVSLERRTWGRGWERETGLERRRDGSFTILARPSATSWYRLSSAKGKGLAHRVSVAPWVRFSALRGASALTGVVRPRVAGAAVSVQRSERGRWVTVASARTNASGSFRASFPVTPGAYRAVARIGAGYLPGTTPVLHVVAR